MVDEKEKNIIDLVAIAKKLKTKKKTFFKMWGVVFVLSCIWIFPQPRYYTCEVSLAPEATGESLGGGLASLASNFGINIGGSSTDALYPILYPDLMESTDFLVSLMSIRVTTVDGDIDTNYYSYMTKHQKKNWLTEPFKKGVNYVKSLFAEKKPGAKSDPDQLNPFMLSEYDSDLLGKVVKNITCSVDKKTDVITISVKDQDRLICAILADSVRQKLQDHITNYRTKKTRVDVDYYQQLSDSAYIEYQIALSKYALFCDANQDIRLQSRMSKRIELENDMQMKSNTYQAMKAQLEAMKAKQQDRTPVFTTLRSATVPIKPAGPKRMFFVGSMLVLATIIASFWFARKEIIIME